jgi:peptide/nickel transport system permease protein
MTEAVVEEEGDAHEQALRDVAESEGLTGKPQTFMQLAWRRFTHHRLAIFGAVGIVVLVALFILGPIWSSSDFSTTNVSNRLAPPSWEHPFGTDELGRDLFVRTMTGGQYSVRIAITVALMATALGTLLGALAGYFGVWVDTIVSQVLNLFLIVPALVVLSVFALKFGATPNGIAIVLAALLWTRIARVVRGAVMQIKEQEFVQAARAAGARPGRIIGRHIMPNVVGPVLVEITLLLGATIVLESTLSFLGLGVRPPFPTLGNLIQQSKGQIDREPLRVLLPGFFVVFFVLCVNFLGDGMRDALDPKSTKGAKDNG